MVEGDITPAPRSAASQARSGARIAAKWVGLPLAAAVAVNALASLVVGIWFEVTQKDQLLKQLSTVSYPESALVCRTADVTCADEAAMRAGRQIAWLPDGRGFETTAIVVFPPRPDTGEAGRTHAFQEGVFRDALVTVESDPETDDPLVREVEVGRIDMPNGVRGSRLQGSGDNSTSASVRWQLGERSYRLAASVPFGDGDDAMRVLDELAGRVRYADPL